MCEAVSICIKTLVAKLFKVKFMILNCIDITEYSFHRENERIYHVKYYKKGKINGRDISFSGEYSKDPEIRALQKYCVERVKHV